MSAPLSRKNLPEKPKPDDYLTATDSGKSLVALALQFKSLCHVLSPENVGTIHRHGPRNSFRL